METTTYARYKTTLLIAAGIFVVWGILGIFDVGNLPFAGYQTDGNNTITRVIDESPAQQAGMQVGDYLRSIGGIAVEDAAALARRPRAAIGETRTFVVEREGETANLEITYAGLSGTNKALTFAAIVMGFFFIAFGLWPYLKAPNAPTLLLALFGLTLGVSFFGGPYIASYALRTSVGIIITLLVVMGFATLLHFTLMFPKRKAMLGKRYMRDLLYGPAALIFLFLLYRGLFQPPATSTLNVITGILVGLFIFGYFGLSLAAFVHSYVKATAQERKDQGLTYVLAGVLGGFLPILGTVLIGLVVPSVVIPGGNFFFLTIVLIPISLALAVLKSEHAPSRGSVPSEQAQAHVSFSA